MPHGVASFVFVHRPFKGLKVLSNAAEKRLMDRTFYLTEVSIGQKKTHENSKTKTNRNNRIPR